jgi:hypothetical protein
MGRRQEAVEWLCRAWSVREQLPDNGTSAAAALSILGLKPEDCEIATKMQPIVDLIGNFFRRRFSR